MSRRRALVGAALAFALALSACVSTETSSTESGGDGRSGEFTVFAAASLRVAFEEIADLFTEEHPNAAVRFSFAGSSDLVAQVDAGAPADVLATADEATMGNAVGAGTIAGEPTIFATNVLTLVTPAANPAGITGLDASLEDAMLVVCAPQVPCGGATHTLVERLGITLSPVSEESSVTDVLAKVTSGQADAGLVYATDALTAGDEVEVIAVPSAEDVVVRYPVAVVADAPRPELAQAWVDLVTGEAARDVLDESGFGAP
ncbi:MAG TPA: molybdate ABC transporter substrate-binding protein [Actinomycetaceae bacterium]|nr:molybdate ABC transporter substrate-binding protein [Actinomycetaceae bacterium]